MTHREWLAGRVPPAPDELRTWFPPVGEDEPLVTALAAAGADMLNRAVGQTGKDRQAAFVLLASDALLTYACEAAMATGDPAGALRLVLTRLASAC